MRIRLRKPTNEKAVASSDIIQSDTVDSSTNKEEINTSITNSVYNLPGLLKKGHRIFGDRNCTFNLSSIITD